MLQHVQIICTTCFQVFSHHEGRIIKIQVVSSAQFLLMVFCSDGNIYLSSRSEYAPIAKLCAAIAALLFLCCAAKITHQKPVREDNHLVIHHFIHTYRHSPKYLQALCEIGDITSEHTYYASKRKHFLFVHSRINYKVQSPIIIHENKYFLTSQAGRLHRDTVFFRKSTFSL